MELDKAIRKYSIIIPRDDEFYSEEYISFFKGEDVTEEQIEKFEKFRKFHEMYQKSSYTTFHIPDLEYIGPRRSIANSEAVVLGGQTGAGKSALVGVAKREFTKQGKKIFLIDDDEYRKFYPRQDEILMECPEHYTKVTAIGSGIITPRIMKYASDNGLNFIFDGTMKNPRIIETAMRWRGYNITWKIMATSRLESLLSIFERNSELKKKGSCRTIGVDAHDETYYGLEGTLAQLESLNNMGRIQVYRRGESIQSPILMYDSSENQNKYKTAVVALRAGREIDKKRCIKEGVQRRIQALKEDFSTLNPAEREALIKLEESIEEEIER